MRSILFVTFVTFGIAMQACAQVEWADRHNYVFVTNVQWYIEDNEVLTDLLRDFARIDLSVDGGLTWRRTLAYGVPQAYGTNTYPLEFRITPDMWTEKAVIGVRSLWAAAGTNVVVQHEGATNKAPFSICGVRILEPASAQLVPQYGYVNVKWHEAGFPEVRIWKSTNGVSFAPFDVTPSLNPTNEYLLPMTGHPTGSLWIAVSATSNLFDVVRVNVIPN